MVNLRLVRLTLSATGSEFRLVLVTGFPYGEIIQVPWNWIPDSLKGVVRFPGSPGIGNSSMKSSSDLHSTIFLSIP